MTEQQEQRIRILAAAMRKQATARGPHHEFWHPVFEMEACVGGRPVELNLSADRWIMLGEHCLKLQPGQLPR